MTPEELDVKINAENGWPGAVGYVEPRIAKLVAASLLERDGQRSRRDEAARAKRRKALYPDHAEHQPKRRRARRALPLRAGPPHDDCDCSACLPGSY